MEPYSTSVTNVQCNTHYQTTTTTTKGFQCQTTNSNKTQALSPSKHFSEVLQSNPVTNNIIRCTNSNNVSSFNQNIVSTNVNGSTCVPHSSQCYSPILNNTQSILRPLMTTQPPVYSPIFSSQQYHTERYSLNSSQTSDVLHIADSLQCTKDVTNLQISPECSNKNFNSNSSKASTSDVNCKKSGEMAEISPLRYQYCTDSNRNNTQEQLLFEEYMKMYTDEFASKNTFSESYLGHSPHYRANSYTSLHSGSNSNMVHTYSDCRLDPSWNRYIMGSSMAFTSEFQQADSNQNTLNAKSSSKLYYSSSSTTNNFTENHQMPSDHSHPPASTNEYSASSTQLSNVVSYMQPVNYQYSTEVSRSHQPSQIQQSSCGIQQSNISNVTPKKGAVISSTSQSNPCVSVAHMHGNSSNGLVSHSSSKLPSVQISECLSTKTHPEIVNESRLIESAVHGNANSNSCMGKPSNTLHGTQKELSAVENKKDPQKILSNVQNVQETSNNHCMFCSASIEVRGSVSQCSIDSLVTVSSKVNVAEKISQLLDFPLPRDMLPSVLVCPKCFHLINEMDILETRVKMCRRDVVFLIESMFQRNGIQLSPYKRYHRQQYIGPYQYNESQNNVYQQFGANGMSSQNYTNCHFSYQNDSQNLSSFNIYQMYNGQNYCMQPSQSHNHLLYDQQNGHHQYVPQNIVDHNVNRGQNLISSHNMDQQELDILNNGQTSFQALSSTHTQNSVHQLPSELGENLKDQMNDLTLKVCQSTSNKQETTTNSTSHVHDSNTCQNISQHHVSSNPADNSHSILVHSSDSAITNVDKDIPLDYYTNRLDSQQSCHVSEVNLERISEYSQNTESRQKSDHSIGKSSDLNVVDLAVISKFSCEKSGSECLVSKAKDFSIKQANCNITDVKSKESDIIPKALDSTVDSDLPLNITNDNESIIPPSVNALFSSYSQHDERVSSTASEGDFISAYNEICSTSLANDSEVSREMVIEKDILNLSDQTETSGWNATTIAKIQDDTKLISVTLPECDIDIDECDNFVDRVVESKNNKPSTDKNDKDGSSSNGSTSEKTNEFDQETSNPVQNNLSPICPVENKLNELIPSPPPPPIGPPEGLRNVQDATEYHKPTLLGKTIKGKKHAKLQICRQCDQVFSNRQALIRHIERRHKTCALLFSCETCNKKFNTEKTLRQHQQLHETYPCKLCSSTFMKKALLNDHVKERHSSNNTICSECNKHFGSVPALIAHVKMHNRVKKEYSCTVCSKSFACNRNLQQHLLIHSGETPYNCENCNKGFRTRSNMIHHHGICSGRFRFNCAKCGKGFVLKSLYDTHMKEHDGDFAHKCSVCNKGFRKVSDLRCHFNTHQDYRNSANRCSICPKYPSPGCNRGDKAKEYVCNKCDSKFSSSKAMKDHLAFHVGKRNYQCHLCSVSYFYRSNLSFHMKNVHFNTKSFSCAICNKNFSKMGNYKLHLRTHTGEKPYQCLVCGKSSTSLSNYKRHQKCHITRNSVSGELNEDNGE